MSDTVIRVHRENSFEEALVQWDVLVDGELRGSIANGHDQRWEVKSGEHRVLVRKRQMSSNEIVLMVPRSTTVALECGVRTPPPSHRLQQALATLAIPAVGIPALYLPPQYFFLFPWLLYPVGALSILAIVATGIREGRRIRSPGGRYYLREASH